MINCARNPTAFSFAEILKSSTKLMVAGHRFGDLDSVGACIGVYSIARQLGVKAHIVLDPVNNNAKALVELIKREPEYKEVFITPHEALKLVDTNTLLCVVDTSRPEQLEEPELLKLCGVGVKVAECICLFALHHIDAFPVDTHIQDMLKENYPNVYIGKPV